MASSWSQAWADSWANAWGQAVGEGCAWGGNWGTSWGQSWCGGVEPEPEPTVIIYGGDDAPRKRRRKRKTQDELFRELEATIHEVLHPAPVDAAQEAAPAILETGSARRVVDELLVLAEKQHRFVQQAAALRAEIRALEDAARLRIEQDEEDALIWMF
jgi:hypothetical protein